VPSFDHELLVELFRDCGALAVELLRACAGIAVEHARIDVRSIDLSQIAPTEYRADAVVVLYDCADRATLGVIVEVQCQEDSDKRWTWPVYVTALRARFGCPVVLLVLTPDARVAAWARHPIESGHPGFRLVPIVLGFEDVPRIRDRTAALQLPELATLSVLAHPELEIAEAAIEAIALLSEDRARLYLDAIMDALPANVRRRLEARMMKGYEYKSDFARKYYGQGREDGLEKGREDGLRAAVVAVARAKLGQLSDADLAAIEAVSDQRILTELVASLSAVRSAAKARAALNRAVLR
jgi:hypothetical protein